MPFWGTLPMPAVPTPILPEMSTLTRISTLPASRPGTGVLAVLLPWFYRCFLNLCNRDTYIVAASASGCT